MKTPWYATGRWGRLKRFIDMSLALVLIVVLLIGAGIMAWHPFTSWTDQDFLILGLAIEVLWLSRKSDKIAAELNRLKTKYENLQQRLQ